jgi:hypothetical protein
MRRALLGSAVVCLTSLAAHAADNKIDSALATFKSVEGDPGKLKIFCEMSAVMDKAGDDPDDAAQAQIDGFIKQLGPDFETAWDAGDDLDEKSPDGKKLDDALDALGDKCSG